MKRKILILEDDEVNRELLDFYLRADYDLVMAENVKEAVEAIRTSLPDLIICDINLGTESSGTGTDFLKMLKADPATTNIPTVAYTAYNNPNDTNEVQFTRYIPKPITRADFLKTIAEMFPA